MGRDKLFEDFPRPSVTPERYRDLEMAHFQVMVLVGNLGFSMEELLIVKDLCDNTFRRWLEDERMARHEIAARSGVPLYAAEGNIIHLKPAEPA